jgi:hypothetical protein
MKEGYERTLTLHLLLDMTLLENRSTLPLNLDL